MRINRSEVGREKVTGARGGYRLRREKLGEKYSDGQQITGWVATPLGIVNVHSEYGEVGRFTTYNFIFRGYEYRYTEEEYHVERTLARNAHKFAQYVVTYEMEPR